MISVVICQKLKEIWEIDTWLMSCRVLGRRVEEAVLQNIIEAASQSGAHKLIGKYIPTERNIIVKDHYKKLGFIKVAGEEGSTETWELEVNNAKREPLPIDVKYLS